MYGLRRPSGVLDLVSIPIPDYFESARYLRACAASVGQLIPGTDPDLWSPVRAALRRAWPRLPNATLIASVLQLAAAARACEVLSLSATALDMVPGEVALYQTKVRRWRSVKVPAWLLEGLRLVKLNGSPRFFPTLTYSSYRAHLAKVGLLFMDLPGRLDGTHLLRYVPMLARAYAGERPEEIQRFVGHGRLDSTNHYLAAMPTALKQLERR